MCLSTVYTYPKGTNSASPTNTQELCSNVSTFQVDGDTITFTDLLGEDYVVQGSVNKVDFVKSCIYVAV